MIVPLNSPLDGLAADRFLSLAKSLSRKVSLTDADWRNFLEHEITWSRNQTLLNGSQLAYEASVRVLLDLARLGWQVREEGYGIELIATKVARSNLSPDGIHSEKQSTRAVFEPAVDAQRRDPTVRAFIHRMESPTAVSKKKSITLLMAAGGELHARLKNQNTEAVQPYLQLVEADATDEFTGHSLRELWRYFRYSWSIPQFATPGRQLLYLVRDAAHPCHAVMGIIGLNNCALQMGTARETHLGWNLEAIRRRLEELANRAPELLPAEIDWMETQIASALADVESSGLVDSEEMANPTSELIARLRRKAKEFDALRDETLRTFASERSGVDIASMVAETEDALYGHPPVSEDMLNLEAKPSAKPGMQKARRHLVARKRAAVLAELLHARLTLRKYRTELIGPTTLATALETEEVGFAINTVLSALKSRFVGINMLEISTCGAIPPYNHLLGGKLASLLLFSPQIAADYRRIYGGPSIIASQMKNEPVRRTNELVYLGTSSLYAQGSSQYERLRLPAGTIAPDQPELRFQKIGITSGYGTLQFPAATREAVERFLTSVQRFQDVNSIFGEGPSPKLRKLVAGLREIGFPPDALMRHNRPRLIYSVPLCLQALDYLNARSCELPSYIKEPESFPEATSKIITFWKTRWLASRLRHQPSVLALLSAQPIKLSERLPSEAEPAAPRSELPVVARAQSSTLWHQLAASGPKVTSDALSVEELDALHIEQPIEAFMRKRVAAGDSIFLTGNAGDGKTHLLRRLQDDFKAAGADVIEDATALMRQGDMSPVLDRWRRAVADKRPFCVAINEYPLYLLRKEAGKFLPELAEEITRQTAHRLSFGPEGQDEDAQHGLLVLDLSLRNPLRRAFAAACLNRILNDPALSSLAQPGTPLAYNLERLRQSSIQDRLFSLFDRLASQGVRVTVRELWVVLSRLVLGYRADLKEPLGEGVSHWYSETLFQEDPRFRIFEALRSSDPASSSHPVWDARLEEACPSLVGGWTVGTPPIRVTIRPNRSDFVTLKRVFFFEHVSGDACFALEPDDLAVFHRLLGKSKNQDTLSRDELIESINRAYCPVSFHSIKDSLYLWNGHRFHEQPSEIFLANRRVPADQFTLLAPRLPKRVSAAFPDFSSDHIALVYEPCRSIRLQIDSQLFRALWKLQHGLPRKLLADQDGFKIEQFLDSLHTKAPEPERRLLSANLKRRELLEIHLNPEGSKYDRVVQHQR